MTGTAVELDCLSLLDVIAIDANWRKLINNYFVFSLQNEYIKYPVLYELSHKYLHDNQPESNLPDRLEELKEAIRKEIRKELKVR